VAGIPADGWESVTEQEAPRGQRWGSGRSVFRDAGQTASKGWRASADRCSRLHDDESSERNFHFMGPIVWDYSLHLFRTEHCIEKIILFVVRTTVESLGAAFVKHGVFDETGSMRIPV
jgi:hypothetical protein